MMTTMKSGVAPQQCNFDCTSSSIVGLTVPALPFIPPFSSSVGSSCKVWNKNEFVALRILSNKKSMRPGVLIPKCTGSSDSTDTAKEPSSEPKASFGYSRKDVILIGVGVTALGVGLKSGLEFVGVDPLQAGNVVQLVIVLGMIVGWISTYMFRVASKDMTYAQQLRDYESKVMEKRLEGLTEAELQVLLEQVEEEKRAKTTKQAN